MRSEEINTISSVAEALMTDEEERRLADFWRLADFLRHTSCVYFAPMTARKKLTTKLVGCTCNSSARPGRPSKVVVKYQ